MKILGVNTAGIWYAGFTTPSRLILFQSNNYVIKKIQR